MVASKVFGRRLSLGMVASAPLRPGVGGSAASPAWEPIGPGCAKLSCYRTPPRRDSQRPGGTPSSWDESRRKGATAGRDFWFWVLIGGELGDR
jgi:hypothetical protein